MSKHLVLNSPNEPTEHERGFRQAFKATRGHRELLHVVEAGANDAQTMASVALCGYRPRVIRDGARWGWVIPMHWWGSPHQCVLCFAEYARRRDQ